MKVIIAGTRTITDASLVSRAVRESGFDVSEVVSGGSAGVDALGEQWAKSQGIRCTRIPAQWDTYGRRAGPKRNEVMAGYAEALIAIHRAKSRGTADMIRRAQAHRLPCFVLEVP